MSDQITILSNDSFCSQQVTDEHRVYVKKENQDNASVWTIYSPDGERMAQTFSQEMAVALARQNDLTAVQVH